MTPKTEKHYVCKYHSCIPKHLNGLLRVSPFVTRVLKERRNACCILSPNVASSAQMSEEIESGIRKTTTLHIKRLEKVMRKPGTEGNTGFTVKREYQIEMARQIGPCLTVTAIELMNRVDRARELSGTG